MAGDFCLSFSYRVSQCVYIHIYMDHAEFQLDSVVMSRAPSGGYGCLSPNVPTVGSWLSPYPGGVSAVGVARRSGQGGDVGSIPLRLSFLFESYGSCTQSDCDFVPPRRLKH